MTQKRAARDTGSIAPRFDVIAKAPVREIPEFKDGGGCLLIQVNLPSG
jgi:hypothetical protein